MTDRHRKMTGWARHKKLSKVLERDEWHCRYCGIELVKVPSFGQPHSDPPPEGKGWATMDHVIPVAAGGKHDLENLVASCHLCNAERSKTQDPLYGVPQDCLCGHERSSHDDLKYRRDHKGSCRDDDCDCDGYEREKAA